MKAAFGIAVRIGNAGSLPVEPTSKTANQSWERRTQVLPLSFNWPRKQNALFHGK